MQYVVMSDVHANEAALQAVVQWAEAHLPQETYQYIFLGDLVGYGPIRGAAGCLRWLRSTVEQGRALWVAGNHDEWVMNPGVGKVNAAATVSLLAQEAFLKSVHPDDFEWFREKVLWNLQKDPETGEERNSLLRFCGTGADGKSAVFLGAHASLNGLGRRGDYLFPWQPEKVGFDMERLARADDGALCFLHGHSHFTAMFEDRGGRPVPRSICWGKRMALTSRCVINPGAVGVSRDGDPRASFAVLDADARAITFQRVAYERAETLSQLSLDASINGAENPLPRKQRDLVLREAARLLAWGDTTSERREAWSNAYADTRRRIAETRKQSGVDHYGMVYEIHSNGLRAIQEAMIECS